MSNAKSNGQIGLFAVHRKHDARDSMAAKVCWKNPKDKRGQQRSNARRHKQQQLAKPRKFLAQQFRHALQPANWKYESNRGGSHGHANATRHKNQPPFTVKSKANAQSIGE